MAYHQEPPRIPPRAPQQHHDPDQWRNDPGGGKRLPVSTTQILLGLVLLAIAASLVAFCFGHSGDRGLEAVIASPQDGGEYAPGPIVVRIRASGVDGDPPRWELSYRRVGAASDWVLLGEGDSFVAPRNVGRGGLEVLELEEPGEYEMRLVVDNWERTEQRVANVRFTVVSR